MSTVFDPIRQTVITPQDTETSGGKTVMQVLPADPTTKQMLRLVELSGTLDFWDDSEEDVYTLDDGTPIDRS